MMSTVGRKTKMRPRLAENQHVHDNGTVQLEAESTRQSFQCHDVQRHIMMRVADICNEKAAMMSS